MNRLATKLLSGSIFQPWEWKVCASVAFYTGGVSVCPGRSLLRAFSAWCSRWALLSMMKVRQSRHPPLTHIQSWPSCLSSSFVLVGASQRFDRGWWMAGAASELEEILSSGCTNSKGPQSEGGCFFFNWFLNTYSSWTRKNLLNWNVSTFSGWESFLSVHNLVYYSYRKPRQSEPITRSS